jgi:hypothetical protein
MRQRSGIVPDSAIRTIAPRLPRPVMVNLTAYIETKLDEDPLNLSAALRGLGEKWRNEAWSLELRTTALVVADLVDQGWSVTPQGVRIYLSPPGIQLAGETIEEAKTRLRRSLLIGRERQLENPSVRRFVERLSRPAQNNGHRSSALDAVDDGAALAAELRQAAALPDTVAWDRLRGLVDPVVVECDDVSRCPETGIRLMDLWRYFRHTWSLEYRSIPGRQIPILIRNRARPKQPVIGIAMLASPVLRTKSRDAWIGWTLESFVAKIQDGTWSAKRALRALAARIEANLANIRFDDLASAEEIAHPNERVVFRLEQKGAGAALARERQLQEEYAEYFEEYGEARSQTDAAKQGPENVDWFAASNDLLFVRKRANTLARLLDAKRQFQTIDWSRRGADILDTLLASLAGSKALGIALQEVRNSGLASRIADLSVCGAVTPYNLLLGGKLVALAMASREALGIWRDRYSEKISIISSQIAGRPIRRPAELRVLTTTSLYGAGSSQYNRLRLRASDHPGLKADITWQRLDRTAGFGTVHLSQETVRMLRTLSEQEYRARRINNRFGEGTSPRLRQVREGLEVLGIDSNEVLHHATPRLFYVCALSQNAREHLLGLSVADGDSAASLAVIAEGWRRRWLLPRIRRPDILERLDSLGPRAVRDDLLRPTVPTAQPDQDSLPI